MKSSVQGANNTLNNDLIRRTREVWQPRVRRELSLDEAKEIVANVTGFFAVLAEWSRTESPTSASDPQGSARVTKSTEAT